MGIFLPEPDEWTDQIRPALDRITFGSMCLRTDCEQLRLRPSWETIAKDKLLVARKELEMALDRVRMAEAVYATRPVMDEPAMEAAE